MKKIFYSLFAATALLLATGSCSSEEELIPSGKNEGVEVSFQLALDDAASSRAISNDPTDDTYGKGTRVDNVIAAVYSNGEEIKSLRKDENSINKETLTCNVTFRLIEGQTYDFVFWAEVDGTGFYNTDDLKAIKVNYAGDANDENRDAFTAVRKGLRIKNGGMSENIVLTRPFAQLNIASTDDDHKIAEAAGFGCDMLTSKINIKNVYDTFDAYNETPSGSADIDFDLAAVPGNSEAGEVLKNVKGQNDAEGKDYQGYLSMNYFLAEAGSSQNVDVVARFESSSTGAVPVEISVPHVPVRRNYRTNIIGNILTEQAVFNIIIDPNFKTPDYIVGWDGKTVAAVEPNAEGVYEISSASQLAWIAQQVNTGTDSFEGKTVKLTDNINLGKQDWAPIGTTEHPFKGTLDGKKNDEENYHVDAFNVSTTASAGLFGVLNGTVQNLAIEDASVIGGTEGAGIVAGMIFNFGTIENVTVMNSNVEGNHYVAGIAGYVYGSVIGCTVENVTVTATPNAVSRALTYDNGDKVGGIVGLHAFDNDNQEVKGNTVRNATLKGYRDIGGIAGAADGSKVTENMVENVNIIWDQKNFSYGSKDINAGVIVGRLDGTTLDKSNTASNVTIAVVYSEIDVEGLSASEDGTILISSEEALYWFADEVSNGENFAGKTVKLTADINLGNENWTPIAGFLGTFDGDNHTISNLKVEVTDDNASAGFFASARLVKNLKLNNVNISGHYKTGAVVGDGLCAQIENCHVDGGTVIATPNSQNNNANNVGGVVGYLSAEPTAYVKDSSVKNLTITAYRSVGGIAGRTNGATAAVENCIVENVVVTADMAQEYAESGKASAAGEIVGDNRNGADLSSNTAINVIARVLSNSSASLLSLVNDEGVKNIVLTEDVNVGTTQLEITRPVTIDLNDKQLTTAYNYGGISLKNGASIKNGTINHTGNTAAIKAWNVESIEDVTINVTPTDGKIKGGIVIQSGADNHISLIKNVTITGATNGIETYNCGWTDETPAIGAMENVTIDATDTGILLSAHIGKAKNCNIKGEKYGINMHLKGEFKVGIELEGCTVTGTEASVWGHDEKGISNTNNCSLALTYDAATTLNGPFIWDFEDECKGVVALNRP